jgi:hypothetical protein
MTAIYDMDPSTSTIATAWASSEFGDPETGPTEFWEAPEADEPTDRKAKSVARHAGFVAALAGVFGAGVAFGLTVFNFADWTPPTITLPYVTTQGGEPPSEVPPTVAASTPENMPKSIAAVPDNTPSPTPSVPPPVAEAPTLAAKPGPVVIVSPPVNVPGDAKPTVDLTIPPPPDAVPVPDNPEPTLQLAPSPSGLQPVQPPTLKKPRTTINDASTPGSKPKRVQSLKPSTRTALAKP